MRIAQIVIVSMLMAAGGVLLTACLANGSSAREGRGAPERNTPSSPAQKKKPEGGKEFTVYPVGWVRKADGRTTIVVDKKYQAALLGLEKFSHVWVLYWFDRNDTPQKRSILQVHPGGNKNTPKRGVFATHSPVRPNLIAMTRCRIISVKENVIEIDKIDAFPDTPVIDMKN